MTPRDRAEVVLLTVLLVGAVWVAAAALWGAP